MTVLSIDPGPQSDMLLEVAEEMVKVHRDHREEQARWIINALGEALDKGKRAAKAKGGKT